jgi:hypothetical protein
MRASRNANARALVNAFVISTRREGVLSATYKAFRYTFLPLAHRAKIAMYDKNKADVLSASDIETRFTKIYMQNFWGSRDSASGDGSTLQYTRNLRRNLPRLFSQFPVNSVFDAPCGDFAWMRSVVKECAIGYIGADIVKPLIETNIERHGAPGIEFVHLDVTKDSFPKADLWICRDCLIHLSFEDGRRALQSFVDSGIPYIFTTTYKNDGAIENYDIASGDFRRIDLFKPPYSLPRDVLFRVDDYLPPYPPREMCLWSRAQIIEGLAATQVAPGPRREELRA